jgi:geranylgeranyl pyrophosphate synthase
MSQTEEVQRHRTAILHTPQQRSSIEVVNEIQIVVHKNAENSRSLTLSTQNLDASRELARKCLASGKSSKTDLTATTPTTVTLEATKNVKNAERRTSKDRSESSASTICVCGKLLKRVKEILEAKETKAKSE